MFSGIKYLKTEEMERESTYNRRYVKKWRDYHAEQARLAAETGQDNLH